MEKILERKFIIGVIMFLLLFIYVGGVMTKGRNNYNSPISQNNIVVK